MDVTWSPGEKKKYRGGGSPMKKKDDRVKARCPAPGCRQVIHKDRMERHLRKAHQGYVSSAAPQSIGRVVVALSSSIISTSRRRAPDEAEVCGRIDHAYSRPVGPVAVTNATPMLSRRQLVRKRTKAAASANTNPPKKVFRAPMPVVPPSKAAEYLRRLDEDDIKRYIEGTLPPSCWRSRLSALGAKALGYSSYKGYLGSKRWKRIRARVLERDGHACRWCGEEQGLEVHHEDYSFSTMCGDTIEGLTTLCHRCHNKVSIRRVTP